MRFGNLALAGDTQERKEHNHRATACGEPERSGHSIRITNQARAEEGSTPEPGLRKIQGLAESARIS